MYHILAILPSEAKWSRRNKHVTAPAVRVVVVVVAVVVVVVEHVQRMCVYAMEYIAISRPLQNTIPLHTYCTCLGSQSNNIYLFA